MKLVLSAVVCAAVCSVVMSGCATMPGVDTRAALLAPCANPDDTTPWMLSDKWDDGEATDAIAEFRPDGKMIYGYDGKMYDNGRWSIDGTALTIDTNDHYADFKGTFDGNSATGTMKNVDDTKGTWTLSRDCLT